MDRVAANTKHSPGSGIVFNRPAITGHDDPVTAPGPDRGKAGKRAIFPRLETHDRDVMIVVRTSQRAGSVSFMHLDRVRDLTIWFKTNLTGQQVLAIVFANAMSSGQQTSLVNKNA